MLNNRHTTWTTYSMSLQPTALMPRYIVQPTATLMNYISTRTTTVSKLSGYVKHLLLFSKCGPRTSEH
jgi:hypothetical protein